ncbi:Uma2 family endonuclease [Nostoc punctiforme]|uniref:Uma2 family endonuclease n=1 Tax=Nostoc punctiforme TaxID=272131 RepID=UPI000038C616|nr:Uma2 family endonuclease [Nostoc punctiforme]
MTQTRVRLWNVDEYHRMLETGIITADERVELIDGQVIPMSAKNPPMQRQRCVRLIISRER